MGALNAGLWGGLAALSLLVGAVLAIKLRFSDKLIGAVMGFGAGALLSSIAYELVPESSTKGTGRWLALRFLLRAVTFFTADRIIDGQGGEQRKAIAPGEAAGGSGTAIFLGTLLDGIPESLILGIGLATGGSISLA